MAGKELTGRASSHETEESLGALNQNRITLFVILRILTAHSGVSKDVFKSVRHRFSFYPER